MQRISTANGCSNPEEHLREQLELLQKHDSDSSPASSNSNVRDHGDASSRPSNGYGDLDNTIQESVRAGKRKREADSHIHPDLRAAQANAQAANMMPISSVGHNPGTAMAPPPSAPLAPAPPPAVPEDPTDDRNKPKRELSQSKRAAQNRAAQRAFRQRKEGYIKKLEQQVRDYGDVEQSFKQLQSENYALREYVIHLQARLLDTQGEFPPPPPNVNLSQSHVAPPNTGHLAETGANHAGAGTPLEAVAQAVAGLAAQEQIGERQQSYPRSPSPKVEQVEEDTRSADEINRQLNPEESASQS